MVNLISVAQCIHISLVKIVSPSLFTKKNQKTHEHSTTTKKNAQQQQQQTTTKPTKQTKQTKTPKQTNQKKLKMRMMGH